MKHDNDKFLKDLDQNCDHFASLVRENLAKYLAVKCEQQSTAPEGQSEQDLHFSILFNGTIYGEFFISMTKQHALNLIDESSGTYEDNQEEIFDSFKEILNLSVGNALKRLQEQFKFITITSPRVTVGQLYLPKVPICHRALTSPSGNVTCSMYIDQMKLTLASEYENSMQKLCESEQNEEQLKILNKTKSEFLAKMSHELRTPLNGMIGNLELLKQTHLNTSQRQQIETVYSSGDFLLGIINDILDFSKIESGKLEVELRPFPLHKSLEGLLDGISNQVYAKGLELKVEIDPSLPDQLTSDETRLRQVLMNLLGNAVKFTPNGAIHVKANRQEDSVRFSVKDSGIGIPKAKLEGIFESFVQADVSDNRKYGGSGLGLTISKSIVEALNGELKVESIESEGTEFYFELPLQEQDQQESAEASTDPIRIYQLATNQCFKSDLEFYASDSKLETLPEDFEVQAEQASHLFLEWNWLANLEQKEKIRLLSKINSGGIPTSLMLKPSEYPELEDYAKVINGTKGSIVRLPMTARKWKASLQSEQVISLGKAEPSKKPTEAPKERSGAFKALLVDDNMINLQLAKTMLESFGLAVETASNGEEAVEKSKDSPFDIIFMDCQMPVMDGYQATQLIREGQENPNANTVIVALTANAFREVKERCFEFGMTDFATKPIKMDQLKSIVDKSLPRSTKRAR